MNLENTLTAPAEYKAYGKLCGSLLRCCRNHEQPLRVVEEAALELAIGFQLISPYESDAMMRHFRKYGYIEQILYTIEQSTPSGNISRVSFILCSPPSVG